VDSSRPDGPNAPVILDVDAAHVLLTALERAVDDRDLLRTQLDEIDGLPETDDSS
jgi:hypothetical protein